VIRAIFLDSGPLSLLTQRRGVKPAEECRAWAEKQLSGGATILVPEIVDFELRRELIRAGKTASLARLDAFISANDERYLPLTTAAMRLAAQLWADLRKKGIPTADPRELDVDVVLAAQTMSFGLPTGEIIIATNNLAHLSRCAPVEIWSKI
jgi:predicted nucleic acid-binding protein